MHTHADVHACMHVCGRNTESLMTLIDNLTKTLQMTGSPCLRESVHACAHALDSQCLGTLLS